MVPLLLISFSMAGIPIEALLILGIIFIAFILLRGKLWKKIDRSIETHLPFTKTWPDLAQKALVVIIFLLIYMLLKSALFFLLALIGIDMQAIILDAYNIQA